MLQLQNGLTLVTDEGAEYDWVLEFDADSLIPQVTWGTSPGMGTEHYMHLFRIHKASKQKMNVKLLKKRLNIWI